MAIVKFLLTFGSCVKQAFVTVHSGTQTNSFTLKLAKDMRDRQQEDAIVSRLVLQAISQSLSLSSELDLGLIAGADGVADDLQVRTLNIDWCDVHCAQGTKPLYASFFRSARPASMLTVPCKHCWTAQCAQWSFQGATCMWTPPEARGSTCRGRSTRCMMDTSNFCR